MELADGITLNKHKIRNVMVCDMGLIYRKVNFFKPYVKTNKNIFFRKLFDYSMAVNIFDKEN